MCCCKTIVQLLLTIYGAKSQLSSTKASCSQCSSITQVFIVCWSRGSKSNSISLNSVFPTLIWWKIHSKLSSSHPKVEFMLRVDNWTTQLNRAKLLWRLLFEFQAHLFAIEKEECVAEVAKGIVEWNFGWLVVLSKPLGGLILLIVVDGFSSKQLLGFAEASIHALPTWWESSLGRITTI